MKRNKLWVFAVLSMVFTGVWLILMIISVSINGSLRTPEEVIEYLRNFKTLYYLTYINAVLVTVAVTIFFSYLYDHCKTLNREWSLAGLIFIPAYSVLNLIVYFSQITVVPKLMGYVFPEAYSIMFSQFIQILPYSAMAAMNQLAYGLLGIPSVIFGILLIKNKEISIAGEWLLMLNGVLCILGVIGTASGIEGLSAGSVIGGALFLFSLIAIVRKLT